MATEMTSLDPLRVNADEVYLPNDSTELLTVVDPAKNLIECLTNIMTKYPPRDSYTELEAEERISPARGPHLPLSIPNRVASEAKSSAFSLSLPPTTRTCVTATAFSATATSSSLLPRDATAGTFGRAGQLYLLRLVRHWFPESKVSIDPYLPRIIDKILADGPPWPFSGFDMIGAAHERSGVCMQILLTDASYAPKLVPIVEQVLGWQMEDGNWPNTVPGSRHFKEILVQFCHGVTGVLISLETIRPYFDDFSDLEEKIAASVARGRKLVWERGLLRKERSICHGITGNAFAFPRGKKRDHFLAHATEESVRNGLANGTFQTSNYGSQYSLGMGDVGRATGWFWHDRKDGAIITYNDV